MPSGDPRPEAHHRYVDAILYALRKHGEQRRKDGRPYISHTLRVAESLRSIGGITDPDVLIAGVLHDVIEDTDCEWASVESRFGRRVADLVSVLSGDMRLPKPERRSDIIERIRGADDAAKSIRLADRLDNLSDMHGFSPARKREYRDESKLLLEACQGANPGLESALSAVIEAL